MTRIPRIRTQTNHIVRFRVIRGWIRCQLSTIDNPIVVLLWSRSPQLFSPSKAASTVDEFVPKGDPHFTVWTLDSPSGHQCLSFPPKVSQRRHSVLGSTDVPSIRLQLGL